MTWEAEKDCTGQLSTSVAPTRSTLQPQAVIAVRRAQSRAGRTMAVRRQSCRRSRTAQRWSALRRPKGCVRILDDTRARAQAESALDADDARRSVGKEHGGGGLSAGGNADGVVEPLAHRKQTADKLRGRMIENQAGSHGGTNRVLVGGRGAGLGAGTGPDAHRSLRGATFGSASCMRVRCGEDRQAEVAARKLHVHAATRGPHRFASIRMNMQKHPGVACSTHPESPP